MNYLKWSSTPIENLLTNNTNCDIAHHQMCELFMAPRIINLNSVKWAKHKLGKQNYTWNGEYRYWIWEQNKWRLFANNKKGLCFEVQDNLLESEALD